MERKVEAFGLRRSLAATTALVGLVALGELLLLGGARAGTIGVGPTAIAYSGTVVDDTIVNTGTYDITAIGGGGGGSYNFGAGGAGATAGGDFLLSAGTIL